MTDIHYQSQYCNLNVRVTENFTQHIHKTEMCTNTKIFTQKILGICKLGLA